MGAKEVPAKVIPLDGLDPLLYAAKRAIGPRQLTEEEAKKTARRAYQKNSRLTSLEIGKAVGRSRQAVDAYITDLRAAAQMDLDLNVFRMGQLNIPQERIVKRLGVPQQTISRYLSKMPGLAKWINSDLKHGLTVSQAAEKHKWRETHIKQAPMSSERFEAGMVAAMQKKRILGVTSRYVIIAKKRLKTEGG